MALRRAPAPSPTAPALRAARAAAPAPAAGRRRSPASPAPDEPEALRHVAHIPARPGDLVAQPVRLAEVAACPRLLALLGQLPHVRRRLLLLRQRADAEDVQRTPQKLVIAP